LTAPARRSDAANPLIAPRRTGLPDAALDQTRSLWREAVKIRQEWLGHGLSTEPADRQASEQHLTAIYARIARPRPSFVWVDSPAQAIPLTAGWPTLDELYAWIRDPHPPGKAPLASDLAMVAAQLRGALSAGLVHPDPELSPARKGKRRQPWPDLPPLAALDAGVPFHVVLHQGIRTAVHRSLARGIRHPIRSALAGGGPVPVCWYGQHDSAWVAYYDVLHRLGLARYGLAETTYLGHWAALARSCGWWWPGERVCVIVERPATLRTEPVPGTWHDELRLRPAGVGYRDGWCLPCQGRAYPNC
jgi:hypothetical protein